MTTEGEDRSRGRGRGGWIALALIPAFVAASIVVGQNKQPDPVDTYGTAVVVWLAWLLLPIAVLAVEVSTAARLKVVASFLLLAISSGLVVYTAWVIRPQAPTGREHAEHLRSGTQLLAANLKVVLSTAIPGRWDLGPTYGDQPCLDRFGRDRGAASTGFHINVSRGGVTLADLAPLQAAFVANGWQVHGDDRGYHGTSRNFYGSRSGYLFVIRPVRLDGTPAAGQFFTASTPCLRSS